MKPLRETFLMIALVIVCLSCDNKQKEQPNAVEGTWQLFSATLVEKGDTTVTDFTKDARMIKVINKTHFTFLNHDLNHGKDSTNAVFSAGGGKYTLEGNKYTEYLEYCNAREWEGHEFNFEVTVSNDTLIQQGVEKLENLNIERLNIEKYIRVKE
jgi:hypothetical protein